MLKKDWLPLAELLVAAYGPNRFPSETLIIWFEMLKDLDAAHVRKAVEQMVKTQPFPSIAEIRAKIPEPPRPAFNADYEHERSALRDNIARLWVSQGRFADRFQAKRELDSWSIEQMREEFRRGTA